MNPDQKIQSQLKSQGYSILQRKDGSNPLWQKKLQFLVTELRYFQKSWGMLPADNFLNDGGHYRYRRYSVFNWRDSQQLTLLPHEPHYQSTYRNAMNGGIYRDFDAFEDSTLKNPVLHTIINWCIATINFHKEKDWRIQAHQFRIQTNNKESGKPTPEGIHKDGADFILIMLLERNNITGGVSHIYDAEKHLQFGAVLEELGDCIILDDRKVWHGVSEIHALDKSQIGYRDVLVLTFHKKVHA
ncbi:MAG: hypothetical protein DSZ29_04215 [Aquificaceae bacterium]|nr:MAG: hypothetical protein DSZ29_04215 [Aquificaceae bacterium]